MTPIRKRLGILMSSLAACAALLATYFASAPPAQATLTLAGPVDPATGFPASLQDANKLRLGYCFDPALCLNPLPNPAKPPAVAGNFPPEMFYWEADTTMPTTGTGKAFLQMATEAAFLPGPTPANGQQVVFNRIRIRVDNLVAGTTYTITHPYGVDTLVATGSGVRGINTTIDAGCLAPPCGTFATATLGRIGPWLTWDPAVLPAPPAGFVGSPLVPHKVTGSPFGTNFFRIEGPNVGGPGVNVIQTDLFNVQGKISGPTVTASPAPGMYNKPVTVTLTAEPAGSSVFYTLDGKEPTPASTKYTGPFTITRSATVKYMGVDAAGNPSPAWSQTYLLDSTPPVTTISWSGTQGTGANYRSAVTAAITSVDAGAGLATLDYSLDAAPWVTIASGDTVAVESEGHHTLTVRAADLLGNTGVVTSNFVVDMQAPTPDMTIGGTLGTDGVYRGQVNAILSANDGASGSGAPQVQYSIDGAPWATLSNGGAVPILGTGNHVLRVQAQDLAGNLSPTLTRLVDVLSIVPVRSPAANANGWNNTDVTVSFDCGNSLALATCSGPATVSAEGMAQSVSGTVVDQAGRSATITVAGINVDKTAPVVTYTGNAGRYNLTDTVLVTCAATDNLSGVASSTCANVNAKAYTFNPGANTVSATATDKAGNVGSGSAAFTVVVTYDGLCSLTKVDVSNPGVASGLCSKLTTAAAAAARGDTKTKDANLSAYAKDLSSQVGRTISAKDAATLTRLAGGL